MRCGNFLKHRSFRFFHHVFLSKEHGGHFIPCVTLCFLPPIYATHVIKWFMDLSLADLPRSSQALSGKRHTSTQIAL
jgi:hypothetical protein